GVKTRIGSQDVLEYRKKFTVPSSWKNKRILLNLDAVNWEARVELNKKLVGVHKGGYDRFSFDITDFLNAQGEQTLVVTVTNPLDHGSQPRGKQTLFPNRIWYTSSSGIWQSV